MNPLLQALFGAWEWRPVVVLVMLLLMSIYVRGWWRLRHKRGAATKLAIVPRLVAYLAGMVILAAALMSPIDRLGPQLFLMHMVQHLLTIMIAAPLLCLADPFPIGLWGLPRLVRRPVARLFMRDSVVRQALRTVTQPAIVWLAFIFIYLGWHDAGAYNAALRLDWVHDIQHITFFVAALGFWWHVIGNGPRLHAKLPGWARLAFVLLVIPPNAITGAVISFAQRPIYTYYESVPRIWGISVMDDQMWGGIIMYIPGSMMFIIGGIVVLALVIYGRSPEEGSRESRPHPLAALEKHRESQLGSQAI